MSGSGSSASRGRGVWGFLAFSHGWTWLLWAFAWVAAAVAGTTIWRPPALWFFVAGGMGVLLGGMVMSRLREGGAGLRDLARRILDPRGVGRRWWAVVLWFFPALTLLAGAVTGAIGGGEPPLDLAGAVARVADPAALGGLIAFTLVLGPLPEEVGWRGYLLDRLQKRWKALSAAVVVGLLNWVWHFPLFLLPGYFEAFNALPSTPLHLALVVLPAGVLYAWVYNNTGRSVLAVILFHFTGNFSGELLGISDQALVVRLVLTAVLVAFIAWWWGPDLRKDRLSEGLRYRPDPRRTPSRGPSAGSSNALTKAGIPEPEPGAVRVRTAGEVPR